jgi:GH24 family phage-related lysozyme (muramidase)
MCDSVNSRPVSYEKSCAQATVRTASLSHRISDDRRSQRGSAEAKQMAKSVKPKSFEDVVSWFRNNGFEITEAPGASGRVFLKKYQCSAAIERAEDGGTKIFAYPGYLINGEISKLTDLGHQKILKTSKNTYPATADHLKALHEFSEELKEGLGGISLYNEGLGTVSESYMYDRLRGRDLPESERPKRPWQRAAAGKKRA